MKKSGLLLFILAFSFLQASSQSDSLRWVKEINEQVWKPFVSHFISGDKEEFRAVHSKKIVRVNIDKNQVRDYNTYFPPINLGQNEQKVDRLFEIRFSKRISNGTMAWETGFFKGAVNSQGKEQVIYYGKFYIVLEKENGIWKIIVDADSNKEANEELFNNASGM